MLFTVEDEFLPSNFLVNSVSEGRSVEWQIFRTSCLELGWQKPFVLLVLDVFTEQKLGWGYVEDWLAVALVGSARAWVQLLVVSEGFLFLCIQHPLLG